MSTNIYTRIIDFLSSEKGRSIIQNISFYSTHIKNIIKNISDTYSNFDRRREESFEEGFTRKQNFDNEMNNFNNEKDEFKKEFDFEEFIKSQMDNIKDTLDSKFDLENKEWFINIKDLKEFLTDDLDEERFHQLVSRLTNLIIETPNFDVLQKSLGEEKYENLVGIVVTHSLHVVKTFYENATNKITEFEFKEKLNNFYENYVLTVLDFINKNDLFEDYGLPIMNFAFGNKATAITNIVFMAAEVVMDEEKRETVINAMKNLADRVRSMYSSTISKFKKRKEEQTLNENHNA